MREKSSTKTRPCGTEAVVRRYSVKKVFLEISQNSQENTCARASLLIKRLWHRCFPLSFAKVLRTSFFHRTALVDASGGTPALVFCPFEDWQLRTTLWYLLCKKDSIKFKRLPSIPLFLSLCVRPLCQTLSKAWSRKLSRTSKDGLASKAHKNVICIALSWCIQSIGSS